MKKKCKKLVAVLSAIVLVISSVTGYRSETVNAEDYSSYEFTEITGSTGGESYAYHFIENTVKGAPSTVEVLDSGATMKLTLSGDNTSVESVKVNDEEVEQGDVLTIGYRSSF